MSEFTIKSAEFMTSIADAASYVNAAASYTCPEICVAGRSNVGKSTFINMLSGKNKLARTSSTPGRTRLLNLFNFNNGLFTLVDLPGYGYAAASKAKIDTWSRLIEDYFNLTQKLLHVFWLVDIRHEPTKLDMQMLNFLFKSNFGFTVVATKLDKIKKSQIAKNIQVIASALRLGKDNIIPVSGETKEGKSLVLKRIGEIFF